MHLNQIKNTATGRVYLAYAITFRDPVTKKNRQKVVEPIGYLDEFIDVYDDPIAHFKAEAKRKTELEKQKNKQLTVTFSVADRIQDHGPEDLNRKNLGSAAICRIYHDLELDYFINNRRRYTKASYNHNAIFRLLIYERILHECSRTSRMSAHENRGRYFEKFDVELEDIYKSLGFFDQHTRQMLVHLDRKMRKEHHRRSQLYYYDVTNYYFESADDQDQDGLRRRGASKEHRPNPIVQLGLCMDEHGYPVTYDVFRGNMHDSQTFKPMNEGWREEFGVNKMIYVADKGMMSGDNVAQCILGRQGYIISNSVRKASAEYKRYVLDESGYQWIGNDYKFKERYVPRAIRVSCADGKKRFTRINERQIVFWSRKYQQKARFDRMRTVEKAKSTAAKAKDSSSVKNTYGAAKFLKEEFVDLTTGELIKLDEKELASLVFFDQQRLGEEEQLDGYYIICTNVIGTIAEESPWEGHSRYRRRDNFFQLNKEVPASEIIQTYRGLWKIEESFKITKSTLHARPVFVWKEEHIRAHFLICFVSLLILRLLEQEVCKQAYSAEAIARELSKACGTRLPQGWFLFDYEDPKGMLSCIGEKLGIDFAQKVMTPQDIRSLFGEMKKKRI
jgi:transposase